MSRDPENVPGNDQQMEKEEDFATLFESSQRQRGKMITKDSKIEGTVVSIGEEWVFVDIGGKSDGAIAREELLDENGNLTVDIGEKLTAYVLSTRGDEVMLSVKMTAAASEEALRDAYSSGVPVEGLVTGERKGGYTVMVLGKEAFCPYSQMDIQPGGNPDDYINRRLAFRIMEYSERGRNIVLSRREILEEERIKKIEKLKKILRPGDTIHGTVKKLAQFGAFVDIGGIEGLIPLSEMAWFRVNNASDILAPGESVIVRIMELDWANERISLSLKQTLEDPWNAVAEKYPEGKSLTGTITRLMNFGAFVELEPGVEGLLHISNLGMGRRIKHPREAVSEGETVAVRVASVDQHNRRIGLELDYSAQGLKGLEAVKLGDVVSGTVDSVKDYGVFIILPDGKSGLLHVSEIGEGKTGDLRHRFPVGSAVEVEVIGIDPQTQKISLSTRSLSKKAEESQFQQFLNDKGGRSSLGTLGDLLKQKLRDQ